MTWLPLAELLLHPLTGRAVALAPALDHAQLQQRALRLAGALQARGVQRVALYLEAEVALEALYTEGYLEFPFRRTLSRLREMQLQRFC